MFCACTCLCFHIFMCVQVHKYMHLCAYEELKLISGVSLSCHFIEAESLAGPGACKFWILQLASLPWNNASVFWVVGCLKCVAFMCAFGSELRSLYCVPGDIVTDTFPEPFKYYCLSLKTTFEDCDLWLEAWFSLYHHSNWTSLPRTQMKKPGIVTWAH